MAVKEPRHRAAMVRLTDADKKKLDELCDLYSWSVQTLLWRLINKEWKSVFESKKK